MIVYLYRWRIKKDKEGQFEKNWSKVTLAFRELCGSYGSRLHIADNGDWVGYAQWPDRDTRENCKASTPELVEARALMQECVEQSFPALCLEIKKDFLIHKQV
jgi:hypothetical protein